jgi:hypothetical protein
MAVPHITNIYPSTGHAGGEAVVRILGGDFADDVSITFGGTAATTIQRVNHALVYATTPVSPLSATESGSGAGSVDVVITNLDSSGEEVPGEEYTVVDGYTYKLPVLAVESDLERVVRELIVGMRRQLIAEVVHFTHLDFSSVSDVVAGRITLTTLPSIALIGPTIIENRVYGTSEYVLGDGERFKVQKRPPLVVDLQFSLIGAANTSRHSLGLLESVLMYFEKTTEITIDRSSSDSTLGTVTFPLDFVPGGLPTVVDAPTESNVMSFSATVGVIGVMLGGFSTTGDIPESDMAMRVVPPPPTTIILDLETL